MQVKVFTMTETSCDQLKIFIMEFSFKFCFPTKDNGPNEGKALMKDNEELKFFEDMMT